MYIAGKFRKKHFKQLFDDLIIFTKVIRSCRYFVPFVYNSVPKSKGFLQIVVPNLDDDRFKSVFRVNRITFSKLLAFIKDHPVFEHKRRKPQLRVDVQLLVALYRLGSYGEGSSILKVASLFGIGDGGTIQNIIYY